jgi:hypothetical protein
MLMRAEVSYHKSSIMPKHSKDRLKHTRFVGQVMEPELAGDQIETIGAKWQYRAICLNPGDIAKFRLCLPQHSKRSIKSYQACIRRNRPICHELVSCSAGDVQYRGGM